MSRPPRPRSAPRLDGLAPRVAALLSLALLPLGLIAVIQTREIQRETEMRASLSLLAMTGRAAAGVQESVERGLVAAQTLGVVSDLLDDPATCSTHLRRFVEESGGAYTFVGLLPAVGPATCASADVPPALVRDDDAADPTARPRVRLGDAGALAGDLVVTVPVVGEAGGFDGRLVIAMPRDALMSVPDPVTGPLGLVTFTPEGRVLTSEASASIEGDPSALLPGSDELSAYAQGAPRLFAGRDASGAVHLYTVVPLVRDLAYAMGIWSPGQGARGAGPLERVPLLFPFLMWIVSLIVAFWAIHRLVIRHVRRLGARMRRFGHDRSLPPEPERPEVARELQEIEQAFRQMAEEVLHDEARMEHAFRERGVLLLEVHHRVKNNLQLISSIISMQARRAPDVRSRAILRRLQDRVLTLATIYRSLYTSEDLGDVDAAEVLRSIVEQETRGREGAAPDLALDSIALDADKIVPLSFLAAEAVANALASMDDVGSLSVSLTREGSDAATLAVANPIAVAGPGRAVEGQGLGQHLIRAFSAQLGGPALVTTDDGVYRISVTFPVAPIAA